MDGGSYKRIHIYSATGQRLIAADFTQSSYIVSINGLASGVYIVEVMQNGNVTRKKIVK